MCLGHDRIGFELRDQTVIGVSRAESVRGVEGYDEQEKHNRNVVRQADDSPKLMPIHKFLVVGCRLSVVGCAGFNRQPTNDNRQPRSHTFFGSFISDSSITGAGPEMPPSLRTRQKCTTMKADAMIGIATQCQI